MAFSLNKLMLIGNLGKDAETRFTTTNQAVTQFSLATTHSYKGKDGNWINETTWHNIISWNLPDFLKDALKKGAKFYVEGRLSKRDYTDKEGVKKYVTEVISEKLIPLDGRSNEVPETESTAQNYPESGGVADVDDKDSLPF